MCARCLVDRDHDLFVLHLAEDADMSKNMHFEETFAFQCRAYKLPPFVMQFSIQNSDHPDNKRRRYRFDFCFPDYWLIAEIDGGVWRAGGGAHSHPIDIERNMRKGNDAILHGYSVLHFLTDEVRNGKAISYTQKVLFSRGWRQAKSA